ncbi:MAG: hypothetical protein WCP20_15460 [Desulfuromonadales bacterium]
MNTTARHWSLKKIIIIGSFTTVTLAMLAIAALTAGHLRITRGTEAIELLTVPGVLETSRVVRNLEHLRRYGDTAMFTTSSVERNRVQMSMTLIAMHPSMQASELVKARVQSARLVLGQALAMSPLPPVDQPAREKALALWAQTAEDLTVLADELTTKSSKRASDDAHRIHTISTQTLSWLTFAIVALLLCGLLFGGFILIYIARPLQRTVQTLDQLENNESTAISLPTSPVHEIYRLHAATYALSAVMASDKQHRTELEAMLAENRLRTVELDVSNQALKQALTEQELLTETVTLQKEEIESTINRMKRLEGIISICMHCKKIRNEHESWDQLEKYISQHSDAMFSHGICPECIEKHHPKVAMKIRKVSI